MNSSNDNTPAVAEPKKKHTLRKIIVMLLVLLAAGYGALAAIHRNTDPTAWEGIRSGYKNTK